MHVKWTLHLPKLEVQLHLINIWESTEKMKEGFVSRLMAVMQKIGIPEPQVEIYPAYNVNVFTTTG